MEKVKEILKTKQINIENILCIFIILCPILDIVSFGYRNIFNSNSSPSTIIRPIIPILVSIYLFFKSDSKFKVYTMLGGFIYLIYGLLHLYVFRGTITKSSYGTVVHEAQYIINYTFMILNLFIYIYIFRKSNQEEKLAKSVLIASGVYIISIYISILTKTSSSTYIEGMGYKGWFESGNSIGAILILSLFITTKYIKKEKIRKFAIPIILLEGLFLTLLLGTRTGLFGFLLVIILYGITEATHSLIHKGKINKKVIAGSIATISIILLVIIAIGSTTIQRRKHLQNIEKNIVDETKQQESHITGSLLEIKEKIEQGTLEENYMSGPQKQSIMDLYQIANKLGVKNNDQRMQQLIYNIALVKNQKSPLHILFGNGYLANFRELVLEMEIPAFLFNFGIIGFLLYFVPFLAIWVYGLYQGIKHRKKVESSDLMLFLGCSFVFALSFLAGYTFFNSSNMMMIVVLNTLLINRIEQLKEEI